MKRDSELKNTQHLLHTFQETVNKTSFLMATHKVPNKQIHDNSLAKQKYLNGLQHPKDKYKYKTKTKAAYFHLKYDLVTQLSMYSV